VDHPIEYKFTLVDGWSRKLFIALLRRYSLKPYRRARQRRNTVMVKVPRSFVEETLWPEFIELSDVLQAYLDEVTQRVISQGIHADEGEEEIVAEDFLG
jgi:tRNA nucleotidyltransferase (CCA-adding enzyme)